jgi:plasmid stability protein
MHARSGDMATLTIRNLDENLKRALRRQAAANDRSMEEEARTILRRAFARPAAHVTGEGLGTAIRRLVEQRGGGIDLALPADKPYEPLRLDEE